MMGAVTKHNSKIWSRDSEKGSEYLVWCPACRCGHTFPCWPGAGDPNKQGWHFDGKFESPTFTPSMRLFIPAMVGPPATPERTTCHFVLEAGKIKYCPDCEHSMKGQTVETQDIPENYGF